MKGTGTDELFASDTREGRITGDAFKAAIGEGGGTEVALVGVPFAKEVEMGHDPDSLLS